MHDPHSFRLQDFDSFAPLADIAKRTGTEIVLHGGAAARAVFHAVYRDDFRVDLFDLAPFSSDFDLDHDGTPEQSAQILKAIDAEIPFASWFRWSINDCERARRAAVQRTVSTTVPLRAIRLSTGRQAAIPRRAWLDLLEKRMTFARNSLFGRAQGQTKPDIELHGLMMALNTWTEMQEVSDGPVEFDTGSALRWIDEGLGSAMDGPLLETPRIVSRFWHLLSARLARVGQDRFNRALIEAAHPILSELGVDSETLADPAKSIAVSKSNSAGGFRVPELTPEIVAGANAVGAFEQVILRAARQVGVSRGDLPGDLLELLDPSLELVAVVPSLTIYPLRSGEGDDLDNDPFYSGAGQEFLQLAWDNAPGHRLDPHGLTGQMLVHGALDQGAATALPAVGGTFGPDRGWIRARLDDLIERGSDAGPVEASMLILQARPDQAADTEARPYARRREQPTEVLTPASSVMVEQTMPTLIREEWAIRPSADVEEREIIRG